MQKDENMKKIFESNDKYWEMKWEIFSLRFYAPLTQTEKEYKNVSFKRSIVFYCSLFYLSEQNCNIS